MATVVSFLFGWLANSWVLSILGLIVLTVLILLFGDQIAVGGLVPLADPLAQLGLIAGLWIIWLVWKLVALARERRSNAAMVDTLALEAEKTPRDAAATASDEEVVVLSERFRDALTTLKSARLGAKGSRKYLYQLPWYLMIGPPGGGKTTAIVNSGLKFPLLDRFGKEAIRGVGGTRNCDWFFTDEAVLVDTAGRYVTQDSNAAVDRSAWQGFLALLRKHRRRRPIDGLIVAIGIDEVVAADPARRDAHAEAVRQRVQEVSETLQVRAPIYVVFTKCDLIAGFTEFFSDLRQSDSAQVWGITFPLLRSQRPSSVMKALPREFDDLLGRLAARVVMRLEQETDLQRRGLVLSFPQQVALLREPISDFLAAAFAESRYDQPVLLRGIYLSSATQEGTPIDRLVGTLARTFGFDRPALPAFSQKGRAFFLTTLFRDVIFREADLVTATGFFDRNRALLLRGFYAAAAVVTGLLVAGMVVSYGRNEAYVAEVDAAAAEYEQRYRLAPAGRGNIVDNLWYLTRMRELPGGWADRGAGTALLSGFGLFQGDKLGSAAIAKYRDGLDNILMPDVMARLEEQLRDATEAANRRSEGGSSQLYEALRVYLMMTQPGSRDNELAAGSIAADWEKRYPGARNAELRETFNGHVAALLELRTRPFPDNARLVAAAQQELLNKAPEQRIYDQVKERGLKSRDFAWSLALLPAGDQRFFERRSGQPLTAGVPGFFTPDGYRQLFLPLQSAAVAAVLGESWLLGAGVGRGGDSSTDQLQLAQKVSELYYDDYIRDWQRLIDDIDLVAPVDLQSQDQMVRMLARPNSPLKTVIDEITRQTRLAGAALPAAAGAAAAGEAATAGTDRLAALRRLLESGGGSGAGDRRLDPAAKVDHYFEPMHKLVTQVEAAPPPIDTVLTILKPLQECLTEASLVLPESDSALEPGREVINRCRRAARDVDTEARYQPAPLGRWLGGLANRSLQLVQGTVRRSVDRSIQDAWRTQVAVDCERLVGRRYPLVSSSPDDVNVSDFARFFGPTGAIERFFEEFIRPAADTGVRPWKWRQAAPVGISASSLQLFETAAVIREAFFPGAQSSPTAAFEVEPVSLDKTASAQVALEIGGQRLTFGHGPRQRQRFEWPAAGQSGARVVFTPFDGASSPAIAATGDWAPFRLFDLGGARPTPGQDRFRVVFQTGAHRAEFEVKTESRINPFALPELTRFRCQDQL